ncbi:Pkinase-domain-containing protein [Dentipellis sp. KUC8613]|nr:Pkinase-domain-containing protein [Dentipellis sp. KUC8613]
MGNNQSHPHNKVSQRLSKISLGSHKKDSGYTSGSGSASQQGAGGTVTSTPQGSQPVPNGEGTGRAQDTEGGAEGQPAVAAAAEMPDGPAASAGGQAPEHPSPMPAPATVPCQYRTGKTLGSGTYAIVKEAVHIKTGKYYACKVINKKLMEGREFMVRNEIAVLKRISTGNPNIVTLHDYFETANNLYLCFDLCTGGELFDRICAKGNYHEPDAADLVRTIMGAVKYLHDSGVVHRDLKPENLLFRTPAEDADIMIADFGLSRIMEEEKFNLLTEICGTPGYMAPEIFKKTGHGKPVDIWAMGVITYFLLAGYTPFDRDNQQQEMEAIIAGDYKFEPAEYWENVSETAKKFVSECLTIDPASRPTAAEMLQHSWLASERPHFVPDPTSPTGGPRDLLPHIQKRLDAKTRFRRAVWGITAMKRMSILATSSPVARELEAKLVRYKEESEKENMDGDLRVLHHHSEHGSESDASSKEEKKQELKKVDDISVGNPKDGDEPLEKALSQLSVDAQK